MWQSPKVTDAHAAAQAINRLDGTPPPKAEAVATGDVQETLVGEELEELLPEAASASKPDPGVAGEGEDAAARAAAAKAARLAAVAKDEATRNPPGVEETPSTDADPALEQKLAIIRLSIPDFEWDMSAHWRTRAKTAVEEHGDNPLYLNSILAIEADSVKKLIMERMSK